MITAHAVVICCPPFLFHLKGARHLRTLQRELVQKGLHEGKQRQALKRRQVAKQMSQREVEELMGMRRDIYKRVNGSVRRK